MKPRLDILHIWTEDNLRLQGVHYEPSTKDVCGLFIHGMSGNFIENYFAHVLGQSLAERGIGFVYGHNRGYNHINDVAIKGTENNGYKTVRVGAVYERFAECVFDIGGWLDKCRKLGYRRFILLGHSLGCNKVIYYTHRHKAAGVIGVVLASPPDMVGLAKKPEYQPNYEELLAEAGENVKDEEPRKILSTKIWDWYNLSSRTFLDLCEENGPADNLPVLRNPEKFEELASIEVPVLSTMGENDDIAIRTLGEDLDLIESKATGCPSFTKKFIPKANHTYDRQEQVFANTVCDWIVKVEKQ